MKDKFNILNNVDVNIDEYEEVKFDNNDEFKANMVKKIKLKKQSNIKKIAKTSSVAVISIISLAIINPDIVMAMPIIGKVIEGFDSSTFGSPMGKYIKYSQGMDISKTDKGATISLTDFIIDENMFMIGLTVKSDILSGYKGKNEHDFINISKDILINGKSPTSVGQKARQIDDTTGAVIISGNIADLNIGDTAKINIDISHINQGKKGISGNWEFKFKGEKVEGSEIIPINKEQDIKGQKLVVESLVTSPISNTLILSGIDDIEKYTLQSTEFKIIGDKGKLLDSNVVNSSVDTETGEFNSKIQIDSDLSETNYIELIPSFESDTIDKEIEGVHYNLLTTTGNGEREEIVISRKPTKEELESGYALDMVHHYINIDKNREFLTIDKLIGYEIPVNSKDSVVIKDINIDDKHTKITMQVKGNYEYLSQLVLFDEEMNDIMRWEGHIGAVLEDEKENLYSIKLDKIDESKKYKIALPQTKGIDLDSKDKIRIDINNI